MDQSPKNKTLEKLTSAESILIAVADPLGFEGTAAGLALYLSIAKLGKNVSITASPPSVGDAQRLYGVDKIGKAQGSQTPVIVIENAIENIDKVTYFLDGPKLKVIIHPLPGAKEITKDQISLEYTSSPASLIFSLGIEDSQSLQNKITHEQQISPETWIANINFRQTRQNFAQDNLVDTQSSGIGEVTAKIIRDFAMPIDEDIAYNLYTGIAAATNNFSPALTRPQSLEIAGWLVKFGAGRAGLAKAPRVSASLPSPLPAPGPAWPQPSHTQPQPPIAKLFNDQSPSRQSRDWLRPPKIYKGSKSFDSEN